MRPRPRLIRRLAPWLRPGRAFVLLSALFGLPLVLLTAPFQAPDEPHHFRRAYQVSEGGFMPTRQGNRGGGELPTSVAAVSQRFGRLKPPVRGTTSRAEILEGLRLPLQPEDRTFVPFVAALYPPVGYVPQASAIAAGRALDLPPLALMYLGRVANLLAWVALGAAAIRVAPEMGRPLLLLLLMPVSIFQAASLSADATTNGLAVLFTALVWRNATGGTRAAGERPSFIGWPALAGIAGLSVALSMTKFAYLPLAGLVLLIPADRLGGRWRRAAAVAALAAVNIAAVLAWAPRTGGLDTIVRSGRPDVSPRRQVEYLKSHPAALVTVPVATFLRDGMFLVRSFVGRPGTNDIRMSAVFIFGYLAALVAACRPGRGDPPAPPPRRLAVGVVAPVVLSVGAVGLLNYLYWTAVGDRCVESLHGRYLIPLAPAVLLLIRGVWPGPPARRPGAAWRSNAAVVAVAIVAGGYTLAAVYFRYYGRA